MAQEGIGEQGEMCFNEDNYLILISYELNRGYRRTKYHPTKGW